MLTHQVGAEKLPESPLVGTGEGLPKAQKESGSYQTPQLHEIGTLEQIQGFGYERKDFVTLRTRGI